MAVIARFSQPIPARNNQVEKGLEQYIVTILYTFIMSEPYNPAPKPANHPVKGNLDCFFCFLIVSVDGFCPRLTVFYYFFTAILISSQLKSEEYHARLITN